MDGPLPGGGVGSLPEPDFPDSPLQPVSGMSARHLPLMQAD
eukprot:COSAG06_NODE_350_length_16971_cov_14.110927_15_plen_41_part_00